MKIKQLNLLLILLLTQVGNSQTIVNITIPYGYPEQGKYYKDIFEAYEPFIGTWVFTQDGKMLKIELKKQFYQDSEYSMDYLVGEYQYMESGVEKINTLPLLSNNSISVYDRNIHGSNFMGIYNKPPCLECDTSIRMVGIFITDPNIPYLSGSSRTNFVCIKADNHNKMIINFYSTSMDLPTETSPNSFTVPEKQYILTKQ